MLKEREGRARRVVQVIKERWWLPLKDPDNIAAGRSAGCKSHEQTCLRGRFSPKNGWDIGSTTPVLIIGGICLCCL